MRTVLIIALAAGCGMLINNIRKTGKNKSGTGTGIEEVDKYYWETRKKK